jgi:hypothetical protein
MKLRSDFEKLGRIVVKGAVISLASVGWLVIACTAPNNPAASAASEAPAYQPSLHLERDLDGRVYVRLVEQTYDGLQGAKPDQDLFGVRFGPKPGDSFRLSGAQRFRVQDLRSRSVKYGLQIMDAKAVAAYDVRFDDWDGGAEIYGSAVMIGNNRRPTQGPVHLQRLAADGGQAPDGSYRRSNTDGLTIEAGNAPVFLRDLTVRGFGDAGVDAKSTVYIMNATISDAHRLLRAWGGGDIVVVNSILNAAPGHAQAWVQNARGRIRYHNVLWCEGAERPSSTNPDCRTRPWLVEGEDISAEAARGRLQRLDRNPLPELSPFFRTRLDEVRLEYSKDGGRWLPLPAANTGAPGSPPVGDLRWPVTLRLSDGAYRFRAAAYLGGRRQGGYTAVIEESGGR